MGIELLFYLWLSAFFLVITLLALPLSWCAITWFMGQSSGWRGLAKEYRTQQPPTGKRWGWQSGSIGWTGYNGILILTANAQGLFIETNWFFRFGHPRLFVPWSDFHHLRVEQSSFLRKATARIGHPTVATVRLPAIVFEQAFEEAFEQSKGQQVIEQS